MVFYSGGDADLMAASYQAARGNLTVNDRRNIDACWSAGLNTFASAPVAYSGATASWSPACDGSDGHTDRGLCDENTRLITIDGVWDRTAAPYATQGQPITTAGFVQLWHRVADADPDQERAAYMATIALDVAATAKEPSPAV